MWGPVSQRISRLFKVWSVIFLGQHDIFKLFVFTSKHKTTEFSIQENKKINLKIFCVFGLDKGLCSFCLLYCWLLVSFQICLSDSWNLMFSDTKKAANCCQVKAVSSFVQSYTVAQFDGWTLAVCHHTRVSRDHILWQAVSTALPQLNPKTSWLHWAAVARGEEMNLKKHLMIIWINNVSNGMLWHHYPKALRELMQHIFVLTQHPIWSLQLGTSGCMCGVT